jgi:hypothetical protein
MLLLLNSYGYLRDVVGWYHADVYSLGLFRVFASSR